MPRAQLFEVDGLNPPRRIYKLSLRYRRSIAALKKDNMPPRLARPPPSGRATVNQNHPAATAAAAAAAREVAARNSSGGEISTPTSRDSPSRAAKTMANEKIREICHHTPRTAVAVEAPADAQATAGVTVDFPAVGGWADSRNLNVKIGCNLFSKFYSVLKFYPLDEKGEDV